MTERLRDVERRIETVGQLSTVVTAMRGIAAARVREAKAQLEAVSTYADTIAAAIGEALALPAAERAGAEVEPARGDELVVAIVAEQGFAGAFSERVLARVDLILREDRPKPKLLLVGDRGLMIATQRGIVPDWTLPMVVHAGEVAALAERVADRLYALVAAGTGRARLVHAAPDHGSPAGLVERRLLPFDFRRFPAATDGRAPLVHLPPARLLTLLADEYVFAELCEALALSLAAENEARVAAMSEARRNVDGMRDRLATEQRQLRQEQITEELVELSAAPR